MEKINSAQGEMISCSVRMARHPRGGCMVSSLLSLEVAKPGNKSMHSKLSSDMQESTHKVRKSALQVSLSRVQLTLHATRRTPHGASRLGKQCLPSRRQPGVLRHGIVEIRGSMVPGTTAMHEISTPRPRNGLHYMSTLPWPIVYTGSVGVGWKRHCKTCR